MGLVVNSRRLGKIVSTSIARDAMMPRRHLRLQGYWYTFVYVLEGEAEYRDIHGIHATLLPGHLLIVFPDVAHNYNAPAGGHWKQMWFTFDRSVFASWEQCGVIDPAKPIHRIEPVGHWYKRFLPFTKKGRTANREFPFLTVVRFQEMLLEALYAEELGTRSKQDIQWADQVCEILDQDVPSLPPLPQIARKMGMLYETFRKRFASIIGMSPQQYRNRSVIERACRLMQESTMNNKQIAYRLGFYDEFHFSRRFKSVLGQSPSEFRKTLPLNVNPL